MNKNYSYCIILFLKKEMIPTKYNIKISEIEKNNEIIELKEPLNFDGLETNYLNKILEKIYTDLFISGELKIPKFKNSNSLLIFLEYLIDKFNNMESEKMISPKVLSIKSRIMEEISEEILEYIGKISESSLPEKLVKFLSDEDFFKSFLEKLDDDKNASSFNKKFKELSKVSFDRNFYFLNLYFFL